MRLIDADELTFDRLTDSICQGQAEDVVAEAPTIEAVPVVRCGECIYWHEHEWYNTCDKHIGHGFVDDYFCKDGERRTDERTI